MKLSNPPEGGANLERKPAVRPAEPPLRWKEWLLPLAYLLLLAAAVQLTLVKRQRAHLPFEEQTQVATRS